MELSEKRKVALAFVIGLIIGGGATWLWFISEPAPSPDQEETEEQENSAVQNGDATSTEEDTATAPAEGDSVQVASQIPGTTVTVDTLTVGVESWVAVHEFAAGGELGNILGARWVPTGTHDGVTISLQRNTIGEREYAIVLYRDDGDRIFEFKTNDGVVVDDAGMPFQTTFETTSGAAGP